MKRSVSAVALSWTEEERANYSHVLQFIANAAKLYCPEEQTTICLMTDASDRGYVIILTQGSTDTLVGGGKRSISCSEGCVSLDYILEREQGFKVFRDHSNLIKIFSPLKIIKKYTRGKLLRWALRISCLRYTIEHIDGESNLWADIISR
ncbi:Hypothetical protein PHPALM_36472 [Phytophthora palmivora]|uniref:Reverse transcriptase RNase H-like domain-containing protein n=1 Tax=Phytophthora palmivora TaxID=4796 RepID=A0A2P4WZV1_9STRA|nr:Hypothetical protein PHPALM_36472 [Phytophthora palmivora]